MRPLSLHDFILNLVQIYCNSKKHPLYFAWNHPLAAQQAQAQKLSFPGNESWDYGFLCSEHPLVNLDETVGQPQPLPDMMVFQPGKSIYPIAVPQTAFPEFNQPTPLPGLENHIAEGGYVYLLLNEVPKAVAMLEHPHSIDMLKSIAQELIDIATIKSTETDQQQQAVIDVLKQLFEKND
jgi:hypothetical protein